MAGLSELHGSAAAAACPSCDMAGPIDIGPIPASLGVGEGSMHPTAGGHLYRCEACALFFRFPRLSKSELDACYRLAEAPRWEWQFDDRRDWKLAAARIHSSDAACVLDVGCNDGAFLHGLGSAYRCYGIELNFAAAERAAAKGVLLLGSDVYSDAGDMQLQFDVITAFDVIEHVERPVEFLRILADKLRPGGDIIISTGNTSAASWRFLGSRYWYCWFPEHIVFINPEWADKAARKLGLTLVECAPFSYRHASPLQRWRETVQNTVYKVFPATLAWARRRFGSDDSGRTFPELSFRPPSWNTAKDHMLFRFRKHAQ